VAYVARRLGNRTDLDTAIQAEMKLAQAELEAARTLPWFLLDTELYTTITDDDTTDLAVPEDFLREYESGALWVEDATTGDYTQLMKISLDDLRRVVADDDETTYYYALAGGRFYLAPAADADTRLRIMCYRAADTLSADADENVWLTYNPELLLAKTGMRMAQYLRSPELFAMFQSQYTESAMAQEQANVAREMENFEACMGGS